MGISPAPATDIVVPFTVWSADGSYATLYSGTFEAVSGLGTAELLVPKESTRVGGLPFGVALDPPGVNDNYRLGQNVYGRVDGVDQLLVVDVGVCPRTIAVRNEIVKSAREAGLIGAGGCWQVDGEAQGKITKLMLHNKGISVLAADDFDGLSGLLKLRLNGNDLTQLPVGVFDENVNLKKLNLKENDLAALPAEVFYKNVALSSLDLGSNQLAVLPDGVFSKNVALKDLYLQDNRLTTLLSGVFAANVNLVNLYLGNNQLGSLLGGTFRSLGSLERLGVA